MIMKIFQEDLSEYIYLVTYIILHRTPLMSGKYLLKKGQKLIK